MLIDLEEPFVVLIEPQDIGNSFFHVYPGKSCVGSHTQKFDDKVENATQIADFVERFYNGQLMPILPNENITHTLETNTTLAEFYRNHSEWTIINAAQLDQMAREPAKLCFFVLSCDSGDE